MQSLLACTTEIVNQSGDNSNGLTSCEMEWDAARIRHLIVRDTKTEMRDEFAFWTLALLNDFYFHSSPSHYTGDNDNDSDADSDDGTNIFDANTTNQRSELERVSIAYNDGWEICEPKFEDEYAEAFYTSALKTLQLHPKHYSLRYKIAEFLRYTRKQRNKEKAKEDMLESTKDDLSAAERLPLRQQIKKSAKLKEIKHSSFSIDVAHICEYFCSAIECLKYNIDKMDKRISKNELQITETVDGSGNGAVIDEEKMNTDLDLLLEKSTQLRERLVKMQKLYRKYLMRYGVFLEEEKKYSTGKRVLGYLHSLYPNNGEICNKYANFCEHLQELPLAADLHKKAVLNSRFRKAVFVDDYLQTLLDLRDFAAAHYLIHTHLQIPLVDKYRIDNKDTTTPTTTTSSAEQKTDAQPPTSTALPPSSNPLVLQSTTAIAECTAATDEDIKDDENGFGVDCADHLYFAARYYYELCDWTTCQHYCKLACDIVDDPLKPKPYFDRDVFFRRHALSSLKNRDYDNARVLILRAIEIDGDFGWNHVTRGDIFKEQRQYSDALECYLKAVSVSPSQFAAYSDIAHCYFLLKNYEKSDTYWQRSQKNDPTKTDLHNYHRYAYYLFWNNRFAEAMTILNDIQSRTKHLISSFWLRALVMCQYSHKYSCDDIQQSFQTFLRKPCIALQVYAWIDYTKFTLHIRKDSTAALTFVTDVLSQTVGLPPEMTIDTNDTPPQQHKYPFRKIGEALTKSSYDANDRFLLQILYGYALSFSDDVVNHQKSIAIFKRWSDVLSRPMNRNFPSDIRDRWYFHYLFALALHRVYTYDSDNLSTRYSDPTYDSDVELAVEHYKKALLYRSRSAINLFHCSEALLHLKRGDEAQRYCTQACAIDNEISYIRDHVQQVSSAISAMTQS